MSKRALDEGEIAETTEGENPEEDTVPAKRGKTDEDEVAPAAADESAHTAAEEQPAAPVDTAAAEQPAAASASAASAPDAASLAATTASAATAVSASAAPPAAAPSVPPPYGFATGDAAGQAGNLDPNAEAHPGMMGLKDADLAVMLTQRMEAKTQRNFAVADAIRKQLEAYGIRINDARANSGGSGMWTASDGRRGNLAGPDFFSPPTGHLVALGFTPGAPPPPPGAPGAPPPEPAGATISNADLILKLQARAEAKARRDFGTSDAIRSELEKHGIRMTDSSHTWSATDGRSGSTVGPDFLNAHSAGAYGGGAPGPYSGAGPYGPPPGPHGPPPPPGAPPGAMPGAPPLPGGLSTEALLQKLAEREAARIGRDYMKSDAMREELRTLGVTVDDRLKTFTCTDGRTGTVTRNGGYLNQPQYGGGPPQHYQQPGGYGHGGYGQPAPGYGGPPPGYGQGYGQQAPGYGQQASAPGGQEQYDQWAAYNAQMAAYYSQQGGQYGGGY